MSEAPTTKQDLIRRIHSSYAALDAAVGRLSEAQLAQPIDGTWSAKDMLAHLAAWEQILLHFHIGKQPFEQVARLGSITYASLPIDDLNEALYQRDRAVGPAEARAGFRALHQQTLAALERIGEAELLRDYTPPGRGRDATYPLINWVVGDTYEHYDEHRATIERAFGL